MLTKASNSFSAVASFPSRRSQQTRTSIQHSLAQWILSLVISIKAWLNPSSRANSFHFTPMSSGNFFSWKSASFKVYFRSQPSWFEDAKKNQATFKFAFKALTFLSSLGKQKINSGVLLRKLSSQKKNVCILFVSLIWGFFLSLSVISLSVFSSHSSYRLLVIFSLNFFFISIFMYSYHDNLFRVTFQCFFPDWWLIALIQYSNYLSV